MPQPQAEHTGSLALHAFVDAGPSEAAVPLPDQTATGLPTEWAPPSDAFRGTLRPQKEKGLSFTEQEVLALIAQGLSNDAVATELGIGKATFKAHHKSIASKLGVRERTEMVREVYDLGGQIPFRVIAAYRLSERQEQIGRMIAEGRTNEEIGRTLYLTLNSVKTHVRNLMRKLRVGDRTHAATILYGCVDPTYERPQPTAQDE